MLPPAPAACDRHGAASRRCRRLAAPDDPGARHGGGAAMELYFSPAELARIAGYGEEPVSTLLVSGQVACELCLRPASDVLLTFELPG